MKNYNVTVLIKFAVTRRVKASSGQEAEKIVQERMADYLDLPTLSEFDARVTDCGHEIEVLDHEESYE